MGFFGKGRTTVSRADKISEFTVATAEYGAAVMEVLGTTRISGNVIEYDDFTAVEHKETQRTGKGGKKSKSVTITYTYTAACILGLCEGPVADVLRIWVGKEVYDYPTDRVPLTLFKGAANQQPWPYMVGKHPDKALPYPGLAYMAGVIDLGESASMPSYNFEVAGKLLETGDGVDVNPMDYILYVLEKVGQGDAKFQGADNFRKYCAAAGLLISTPMDATSTQKAREIVNDIAELCGAYIFWSNDSYKIVPLADRPVGSWRPDKTIRYDLTPDDFIPQSGGECVTWSRKDSSEQYNRFTVEYHNRANGYEKESVTYEDASDIAERGVVQAPTIQAGYIYTKARAVMVAESAARRSAVGKNQYKFKLGWAFCRLEPGDLVRLTDEASGIVEQVAMITGVSEDAVFDLLAPLGDVAKARGVTVAIETLNRIEAAEGKSERLSYAKSDIYTKQGNKQAAINEMKALARQYPNDLNYKGMYADMLLRNEEEKQAVEIFNQILAEEPDNTRAQVSLRSYYIVQGEAEKGDSMTEQILLNKNTSTEQRIYLMRQMVSDSEQTDGDSTKILNLFHKMLAQPQKNADIAALCAAYMDLKKMPRDSVQGMLQTVLQIAPDNAAARLQLVSYAWDDKELDKVITLCSDARQYNPEEMAFYYYQGIAYYQQDNKDKALEAFQNGISVIGQDSNPAIVSDFYSIMGDLLHQKGMTRQAFEAYDSCLQWKDDNIMCLNNYAYFLSEMNQQLDKAEQMSFKTIKAEPKNATYLDTYAWILFRQERYAEAKVYIEQALQNDSDSSAVIMEHAGDIYIQNKLVDRAVEQWQQALAKDPRNKVLIRKIKHKKYIRK